MKLPRRITRNEIKHCFFEEQLKKNALPEWLIETYHYTSCIDYSISIILKNPKNYFTFDSIKEVVLKRHWIKDPSLLSNREWEYRTHITKIQPTDFDNPIYLSYNNDNAYSTLSLICILSMFSLYDYLLGGIRQGILFRSEVYNLQKYGIWVSGTGKGRNRELDKIISEIKNSAKHIPEDRRRIPKKSIDSEFLFDSNEILNMICWTGQDSRENIEQQKVKLSEKAFLLNVNPDNINIYTEDGSEITDRQVKISTLKCFFPSIIMMNELKVISYQKGDFNEWPTFSYSVPELSLRNKKQLEKKLCEVALKVKEKLQCETVSYNEILDYLKVHAPAFITFSREELKQWITEKKVEYSAWINERRKTNQYIAKKRLFNKLLRKYYGCSKSSNASDSFYSFKLDDEIVKTRIFTRSEWLNRPYKLGLNNRNFFLEERDLPEVSLPFTNFKYHLNTLMKSAVNIWPGDSYRLLDINHSGKEMKSVFSNVDFLEYKFTIGLLQNELTEALILSNYNLEIILGDKEKYLPLRELLLPNVASLNSFESRICIGGVAVLFAFATKERDDFTLWIQQRSENVCDGSGMRSVIPLGLHQCPISRTEEVCISRTVFREMLEELRKNPDADTSEKKLDPYWIEKADEAIKWLLDHPNSWLMECVTFMIDSIAGAYNYGVLWVIHDPEFWGKHSKTFETNWEVKSVEDIYSTDKEGIKKIIKEPDWNQDGLITFIECLKRLKHHYKDQVDLPNIEHITPKKTSSQ